MDLPLAITLTGGTVSVSALVIAFIQWSLKRNVEHEDKAKDTTAEKLEHHANELAALKQSDIEIRGDLRALTTSMAQLTGAVTELKGSLENNREKQSDFYRQELAKVEGRIESKLQSVEATIRQEITRAMSPELSMRVRELDDRCDGLDKRLTALESRRKR